STHRRHSARTPGHVARGPDDPAVAGSHAHRPPRAARRAALSGPAPADRSGGPRRLARVKRPVPRRREHPVRRRLRRRLSALRQDEPGEAGGRNWPTELAHDVEVELDPGDAVVHDRWTIHATGPNHTERHRRGWALHYVDATSRFGNDETYPEYEFTQTPDGLHWQNQVIYGNRHYQLVFGQELPGCI